MQSPNTGVGGKDFGGKEYNDTEADAIRYLKEERVKANEYYAIPDPWAKNVWLVLHVTGKRVGVSIVYLKPSYSSSPDFEDGEMDLDDLKNYCEDNEGMESVIARIEAGELEV